MRHQLHFAWLWSMDFWRATPNQTIDLHTVEQVILQRVSRNVTGWHGIHRRLAQESRPNRTVSYVHSMVLDQSAIRLRQYANSVVFLFVLFLVSSAFILLLTTRWSARRNTIDRLSNRVTLVVLAVRHLLIQRPITCNLFNVTSAVIAFVSELICDEQNKHSEEYFFSIFALYFVISFVSNRACFYSYCNIANMSQNVFE